MAKYLNPFTDYGFKNLFGKENSKDILIDFLNDLYADLPGMETIIDLTYSDKEMTRNTKEDKTVIYDIRCLTKDRRHIIVEMQLNSQATFLSRAIYYLCRAVSDQGQAGSEWIYDFEPVYGVYFTDFKLKNLPTKVKIHTKICDIENSTPISDKVCLSFIQLELFDKTAEECKTGFDQWIYVLKNLSNMNTLPFTEEKKIFKKVQDISDYHRLEPQERAEYDSALKRYRDYNCTIQTAKDEGRVEGRVEGIAIGAKKNSIEIARAMKLGGMDKDLIMNLTHLTADEFDSL